MDYYSCYVVTAPEMFRGFSYALHQMNENLQKDPDEY